MRRVFVLCLLLALIAGSCGPTDGRHHAFRGHERMGNFSSAGGGERGQCNFSLDFNTGGGTATVSGRIWCFYLDGGVAPVDCEIEIASFQNNSPRHDTYRPNIPCQNPPPVATQTVNCNPTNCTGTWYVDAWVTVELSGGAWTPGPEGCGTEIGEPNILNCRWRWGPEYLAG